MPDKHPSPQKKIKNSMLLDNRNHGKVVDELRNALKADSKLSVLAGIFSVYGYVSLKSELEKIKELRMILPKGAAASPIGLAGTDDEIRLKNDLNLQSVSKECSEWISRVASVRGLSGLPISQNLFHVHNEDQFDLSVHGSANFTAAGLGVVKSNAFEMNTGANEPEATRQLLNWFDTIWNDPTAVEDVKDTLLKQLELLADDKPADLVYRGGPTFSTI